MTFHIHKLEGCSPVPLASYLKALGVLRLVSEQVDPTARGWWKNDSFYLSTILGREELLHFFLNDYSPTPLVAPWNGGSGFYAKDKKDGIAPLQKTTAPRFQAYRAQIEMASEAVASWDESPKNEVKEAFIRQCRDTWRGSAREWLDAAIVIGGDGSPSYPALLGTGGNDGRLDFTNNFMQRIAEMFEVGSEYGNPKPGTQAIVQHSLFAGGRRVLQKGKAIGQFNPGQVGGANAANGFSADSLINPFDFILMLEGTIMFNAGLSRQCATRQLPQAAAPFAVRSRAVGYGSAAAKDEGSRGEQWMPLWSAPSTKTELASMLHEGRCRLGKQHVERPLDFARAVARMSVARGISEFQRFGYIERNGQANLATPLERWKVEPQPHQDLLDQIASWVDTLRRAADDQNAPAGIQRAARNCEEAMMSCCRNGRIHDSWLQLFIALGQAEAQLLKSPRFTATPTRRLRPLPRLSPQWLDAVGLHCTEVRLALAFAAQVGITADGRIDWSADVRRHFTPLDRTGTRFAVHGEALDDSPDILANAPDFERLAHFVMNRRLLMMQTSGGSLPLVLRSEELAANLADIHAFLRGAIDDALLLALVRPIAALHWRDSSFPIMPQSASLSPGETPLYAICKLCHLPHPIHDDVVIRTDPAVFQRLAAGDAGQAVRIACRRLRASGWRSHILRGTATPQEARRIAAALVFPITKHLANQLVTSLTRQSSVNQP